MEKELKIEVPQGYEIDRQKSTFEKIVFKKVNPLSDLPKTWEEYCEMIRGNTLYYTNCDNRLALSGGIGAHNAFTTKKRAEQFIAIGKLLQLRDYWVGDWKPDLSNNSAFAVVCSDPSKDVEIIGLTYTNLPLMFPTKEMAQKFINCFEDLIKEAYPLV